MFVLSAVPLVLSVLAAAFWLPDTIPMHVGFDGAIDGWGGTGEELVFGALLTLVNILIVSYGVFIEKLMAAGLTSGVKTPRAGRLWCLGTIVFIDVVFAAIVIWQIGVTS